MYGYAFYLCSVNSFYVVVVVSAVVRLNVITQLLVFVFKLKDELLLFLITPYVQFSIFPNHFNYSINYEFKEDTFFF